MADRVRCQMGYPRCVRVAGIRFNWHVSGRVMPVLCCPWHFAGFIPEQVRDVRYLSEGRPVANLLVLPVRG